MIVDTLEKILKEKKSRILIDTSVIKLNEPTYDDSEFLSTLIFDSIDVDELKVFTESAKQYADVLDSDNILVLPEVIEEKEVFIDAFIRHYDLMRAIEIITHSRTPRNSYGKRSIPYRRQKINWELYEEYDEFIRHRKRLYGKKITPSEQRALYKYGRKFLKTIKHRLESHILEVHDHLYEDLVEVIKELSIAQGIKDETSDNSGHEELYTDEKLISAAFYLAFRDRDKVTIATSDTHLPKLLVTSFDLLSSAADGLGYQLQEVLHKNPVEMYFLPAYATKGESSIVTTAFLEMHRPPHYAEKKQRIVKELINLNTNYR